MKYQCVCIAVSDVKLARKFYEDLFGLEVFQDYGANISFSCRISLQQDFDRLLDFPKEKMLCEPYNMGHIIEVGENMKTVVQRFLDSGMSMEETSKRMDVSISDLEKLFRTV